MDFTQINADEQRSMLAQIGVERIEDLFAPIPRQQRLDRELEIPPGCSEPAMLADLEALARRNRHTGEMVCFMGCGAYDHFIPTIVDYLAMRGEFLTAYTPYQAEASQGSLQAFYEFQTMICQITGMDIANASLYEGGSALAEAVMMARSVKQRPRVIVSGACHPEALETLRTYTHHQGIEVEQAPLSDGVTDAARLPALLGDTACALVIQQPNFFGCIEDVEALVSAAHAAGALAIVHFDPISAGVLKRPGDLGADVVVGEGQALGIPLQYGAPYLGFFATREEYLRKMPGRVVGVAHDASGKRGFCLVLQTREQHIRREKATSNVCTNQGLMAMRAAVYMEAMGRHGLRKVAALCRDKAHYAASRIAELDGYTLRFRGPFFKEFVVQTSRTVKTVLRKCRDVGILGGVPMGRWHADLADCFAIAVTEKRTRAEIDQLVDALRGA